MNATAAIFVRKCNYHYILFEVLTLCLYTYNDAWIILITF